jgi:hypothetical protein
MTYATSLYNAEGQRREDFALGELAKVRRAQPNDATRDKMQSTLAMGSGWDLYLKPRPNQHVLHGPLARNLIPGAIYEPVVVLPGGTVVADIVMGTDTEALFPGLVVSHYGKGKVAYIPAALDAMYRQTRIRQFADVVREVLAYVSPDVLRLHRKYEGLPLPIAEYGDIHSVAWKTVGHAVRQDRPFGDEIGLSIELDDDISLLKTGLQRGPVQPVLAEVLDPQRHGVMAIELRAFFRGQLHQYHTAGCHSA